MSSLYDPSVENDPAVIEAQGQAGADSETLILGAPVTGAINNLNGLLAPSQLFATSGGVTVSSAGTTHTFSFSLSSAGIDPIATKKSNLSAAVAPTVNEDSGDGYAIGSIWIDTTADQVYMAVDVTVGAAVWKQLS